MAIPEIDGTNRYIDSTELFKQEIKPIGKAQMLAELKSSPAYKLFYETYPDTGEEFYFHGKTAELILATMNYEKNNILELQLIYEWYYNDDRYYNQYNAQQYVSFIDMRIECDLNIKNSRYNDVEGAAVLGFIKYGYCLDLGPDISDTVCREGYELKGTECLIEPIVIYEKPPPYPEYYDEDW